MTAADALRGVTRLGLDSAPLIYFVENVPDLGKRCAPFSAAIDAGQIEAFTSTISLPETLIHPLRAGDLPLTAAFRQPLLTTQGISTVALTVPIAERAARLRADHNLRTPDATQIATALVSGCEAFLTNDEKLKRVTELRVITVNDLTVKEKL